MNAIFAKAWAVAVIIHSSYHSQTYVITASLINYFTFSTDWKARIQIENKVNCAALCKSVEGIYELVHLSRVSIAAGWMPETEIVGWHRKLQSQSLAQTD